MTSTAILTEDTTTIVAEEHTPFRWGVVIVGALAAIATSFFLITLGAGVGLAFVKVPPTPGKVTAFFTLGAIYFLAAQAFGFAVGGYLVGRLIGPEAENKKEEEFRAAAHGFAMWALSVVAGLLLVAASSTIAGSAIAAGAASNEKPAIDSGYLVDALFRPARNDARVAADKAEVSRILAADLAGISKGSDIERAAGLVSQDTGLSVQEAMNRVSDTQRRQREAADNARKAATIAALWTAMALLFGAIVSVAAAISARWMDDRISFSMARRY
jgi:hypothetical protein